MRAIFTVMSRSHTTKSTLTLCSAASCLEQQTVGARHARDLRGHGPLLHYEIDARALLSGVLRHPLEP
jgi:hypothetical protein